MVWANAFAPELVITSAVSVLSLLAVALPLLRGLRVCFRARLATRWIPRTELCQLQRSHAPEPGEALAVLLVRVIESARAEGADGNQPAEFLRDAAKQYVLNEYEANYAQPISMYSNILPPLGFIGTTVGLLVLFVSMHLSNESLQLGALAIALTSTIFALIGLALLESLKIGVYSRLLRCIEEALGYEAPEARDAMPGGPSLAPVGLGER